MFQDRLSRTPICLTLPGLDGSGARSLAVDLGAGAPQHGTRVGLGSWSQPSRNMWIARLERAIAEARGPVVLVAHSLSCHLVAWWAALAGDGAARPVAGAMLVAPPDLDRVSVDRRISPTSRRRRAACCRSRLSWSQAGTIHGAISPSPARWRVIGLLHSATRARSDISTAHRVSVAGGRGSRCSIACSIMSVRATRGDSTTRPSALRRSWSSPFPA